jgi:hypothetical protein
MSESSDPHQSKRDQAGKKGSFYQHFDELGGWCRPKSSGKDLDDITLTLITA